VPKPTTEDIAAAARAFIWPAFAELRQAHVIPTSQFHAYLQVGRDYFGPGLTHLPEYGAREGLMAQMYPERFAEPLTRSDSEFPNAYIFSLLEACVARCGLTDGNFDAGSPSVDQSVQEMLDVLASAAYEVVCCRAVSHLTTTTGAPVTLGGVEVIPEPQERNSMIGEIARRLPAASGAFNRERPIIYDRPRALLIARTETTEVDPFAAGEGLSRRLERFLLLLRLLTGATAQPAYEVQGITTLVSRMHPYLTTFGKGPSLALVRRTCRLTVGDDEAFRGLGVLLDAADIKKEKMAWTSFDVAIANFHSSFLLGDAFKNLVDLATALEAILSDGSDGSDAITLRLKMRASALLSTSADPSRAVFDDVGTLYGLRSKLVHGGSLKEKELRSTIARVSTVPASSSFRIATVQALDRMRDLVRRAILARICLASEPTAVWQFEGTPRVDSLLADEDTRLLWRSLWRSRLESFGAGRAADPSRAAVDFLSRDDR
jgi:hypothetical protein